MLPLAKNSEAVATTLTVVLNVLPDILLITVTITYFLTLSLFLNENLLLASPVNVTLLFVLMFGIIQSVIFCYMWNWMKPVGDQAEERFNQKSKTLSGNWFIGVTIYLCCWTGFHCLCIMFGATLIQNAAETTTWALLVTTLIAVPNLCIFGTDMHPWYRVMVCGNYSNATERFLCFQSLGVVLGSWASAIVIPLDWDRPWQVWPIPCIIGCLTGYCVAVIFSIYVTVKEMKTEKIQ